jgi:hypothetical protein
MADFTAEELDFLNQNGISMEDEDDETPGTNSVEPEPIVTPNEGAGFTEFQGGTEAEWSEYVDNIIAENTPKDTGPAPIVDTRDSFTYDNLYGSYPNPDTGEVKAKPDLSLYDRVGAAWYNMVQPEGSDPRPSQIAKDQYDTDIAQWSQATRDLFEGG